MENDGLREDFGELRQKSMDTQSQLTWKYTIKHTNIFQHKTY